MDVVASAEPLLYVCYSRPDAAWVESELLPRLALDGDLDSGDRLISEAAFSADGQHVVTDTGSRDAVWPLPRYNRSLAVLRQQP